MAALVGVGVVTTLLVKEPHPKEARGRARMRNASSSGCIAIRTCRRGSVRIGAWFIGAVVCPFLDFFRRYGSALGLVLFGFAATYRLTEYTMGPMANPFYIDHGYTLGQIGRIVKIYGLSASLIGVVIAGMIIVRFGLVRSLILGSLHDHDVERRASHCSPPPRRPRSGGLGFVNIVDNLAQAMHGTALIAFMSSLTSPKYTATQYALLSSLYTMPGKLFFEGTSGFVVEAIDYPLFFVYTASLSIPALLILWWLVRTRRYDEARAMTRRRARSTSSG